MAADEFQARRARVGEELAARKLDALLAPAGANLRYLSGFTGSSAVLLVERDRALLFTDPRYTIQASAEVTCKVTIVRGPLLPRIVAAVRRRRIGRLGFERGHTTFDVYDSLRSSLPLKTALEPVAGLVERHRMLKSPAELAAIRASAATNSKAFEQTLRHARAGMRESDLAAELEYRMRRLGADKPAFETIVAAGARSALPHAQPTQGRLAGLVVVDMGAFQQGYASDMTRMLFAGRPDAKSKRLYEAVLEAQLAAIDAVRAGVTAGQVDRAARRVLKSAGLEKAFVHSTGHGLGLEIHEPPRLGRKEKTKLEAGMAITIEPGAYLEGFGGVRIEDTVVVTAAGCEILTPTSKELRIL